VGKIVLLHDAFQEIDGSVNVDLFSWWWSTPVADVIKEEFSMYQHHLHRINGKDNYS
jgi:hypothetical protein